MSSGYVRISPADRSDYRELIAHISEAVWPEFMRHDPIAAEYWDGLFDTFPSHQFALLHEETHSVAGIANSVPLACTTPLEDLPDEGWDWELIKSAKDAASGKAPNVMGALQISVAPAFQGKGLSSLLLQEMRQLAQRKGFSNLIAPVRPSRKHLYPLSSIESYMWWTLADGLPYDPWLRVHVRAGGRILKACLSAMRIVGTVAQWEEWTGLRFYENGRYTVPGALVPVQIDVAEDTGLYTEPGVWVVHHVPSD